MDRNADRDNNDTGRPDAYQPDAHHPDAYPHHAYQSDGYQPDAYWRRRVITLCAGLALLGLLAWAFSASGGQTSRREEGRPDVRRPAHRRLQRHPGQRRPCSPSAPARTRCRPGTPAWPAPSAPSSWPA